MISIKRSLLSLTSVVAFLALAAVSAYLYGGEPGSRASLDGSRTVQIIRSGLAAAWSVTGSWLLEGGALPSGSEGVTATGAETTEGAGRWVSFKERFRQEWQESGSSDLKFDADISEKIRSAFQGIEARYFSSEPAGE